MIRFRFACVLQISLIFFEIASVVKQLMKFILCQKSINYCKYFFTKMYVSVAREWLKCHKIFQFEIERNKLVIVPHTEYTSISICRFLWSQVRDSFVLRFFRFQLCVKCIQFHCQISWNVTRLFNYSSFIVDVQFLIFSVKFLWSMQEFIFE